MPIGCATVVQWFTEHAESDVTAVHTSSGFGAGVTREFGVLRFISRNLVLGEAVQQYLVE